MNDVKFFAYSTGDAPKIWATGDVQGTVNDLAYVQGTTANLTGPVGASFNAQFTMNNYNTGTGNWDASITGSGYVNNPVYIQGAAAGNDATSTGFSGTASGVASVQQ